MEFLKKIRTKSLFSHNKLSFNLDKKVRYIGSASLLVLLVFGLATQIKTEQVLFLVVLGFVFTALVGLLAAEFLIKSKTSSYAFLLILLVHLIIGVLISYYYFPNLGPLFRAIAFVGTGILYYILFIVNNVFLVTEERGSPIPLYSAAIAWAQILIIMISIPYFSGVYKIPTNFLVQNGLVSISTFLLCFYMIWAVSFDPDIKRTSLGEKFAIASLLSFLVFLAGLSVSFVPSESFLRALFISALLMAALAFIVAHYKNKITRRLLFEYGVINGIFFMLLLLFKP